MPSSERAAKTKRGLAVLAFIAVWTIMNGLFVGFLRSQSNSIDGIIAGDFLVWLVGIVIGARVIRQRMSK